MMGNRFIEKFSFLLIIIIVFVLIFLFIHQSKAPEQASLQKSVKHQKNLKNDVKSKLHNSSFETKASDKKTPKSSWSRGIIHGKIVSWPDEIPLPGVQIAVFSMESWPPEEVLFSVNSGNDGKYCISNIRTGQYQITAQKRGYGTRNEEFRISRKTPDVEKNFLMTEGISIYGTAQFKSGAPASGFTVFAGQPVGAVFTAVDEKGYFELTDIHPAVNLSVSLMIRDSLYVTHQIPDLADSQRYGPVNLVIPETGILNGLVLDKNSEKPIQGASITSGIISEKTIGRFTGITNENGEFNIAQIPSFSGHIQIEHPDYFTLFSKIDFSSSECKSLPIFYMEYSGSIEFSGRLISTEGLPLEGYRVVLSNNIQTKDSDGNFIQDDPERITDSNGDFFFDSITDKGLNVVFYDGNIHLPVEPSMFQIKTSEKDSIYQEFTADVSSFQLDIIGSVTTENGDPVSEAEIILSAGNPLTEPKTDIYSILTDTNGKYIMHATILNNIQFLTLIAEKNNVGKSKVMIDSVDFNSGSIRNDFILGNDVVFSGIVVDHNGMPVNSANIRLLSQKQIRNVSIPAENFRIVM